MTTTVSSTEARNNWDTLVSSAKGGDEIIVETDGSPQVVVISTAAYQELQELREEQRRAEALGWLRSFEQRQGERNRDLTSEQVEEIAIEAGREIKAVVAEKHRAKGDRNSTP